MTWTVMRTGSMSAAGGGGGLKLDEVDMATCAEVPKEDIFRFVTEALTIEESYSRMFSLCPSADVSQLKEMRMAGCDRREEAEALLRGQIQEGALEEQAKAAEEKAAAEGAASAKSAEEEEAEREEELKELLAKAKKKGEENAIKRAEEEKLKQARLAPHLIPHHRIPPLSPRLPRCCRPSARSASPIMPSSTTTPTRTAACRR